MDITEQIAEQVQVRFTVVDGDHTYSDALYFTPAEFASLTPEQLMARKVERFQNWKAIVTAPPRVPTQEEIQAQIAALTQQQLDTQAQLLALAPGDQMLAILQQQFEIVSEQIGTLQAQQP